MAERRRQNRTGQHELDEALRNTDAGELSDFLRRGEQRSERIEIRVTEREKNVIQGLADRCGVSVTSLLVGLAEFAAKRLGERQA